MVAALSLAGPADAQHPADVATARELFNEAADHAVNGRWEEARERYERSLKLKRAPITLYSLGVAQRETGRWVEALESFRAFLAEPLAASTRAYVRPAREAIKVLERKVARLTLLIDPPGLEELTVTIDGQRVPPAALDRARLVNPGVHEIVATAGGRREARVRASVVEGGSAKVELHLEPLPEEPPAALSEPKPDVRPAPLPPRSKVSARAPEEPAPSRALPITLIAGGGATLAAGVVVGMLGVSEADAAPTRDGPEASRARTKYIVGDVLGGAGAIAAGLGVILLVASGGSRSDAGAAPSPVSVGARGVTIRF